MPAPRILVLGSNGGLGRCLVEKFAPRGRVTFWTRSDLDLEQPEAISKKLAGHNFEVLLNPAGMTSPDTCESEPGKARLANVDGPRAVAEVCHARGARLIHFSTDYVFCGESHDLLREHDEPLPVNIYGRTKRDGELAVLKASPDALVARVSWLFGPHKSSHPDHIIQRALHTGDVSAVVDKTSVPTSNRDICDWIAILLSTSASGVLHLCNSGIASWHSWAESALKIARKIGIPVKTTTVRPIQLAELTQLKAPRPLHTVMSNEKLQNLLGREIRNWNVALEDYLIEKHRSR